MTRIALDAMGGDFAPRAPVEAGVRAARAGVAEVILVGDGERLAEELRRCGGAPRGLEVLHTQEWVTMDDPPSAVLRDKPRASVRLACEMAAQGRAQAVISAGHSGALMVAGKHALGTLPGIDRPAIATPLPQRRRQASLLLDSGANVDCKPHYLLQFARMGEVYARTMWGLERPRLALLSNGVEPGKGNELVRHAYPLLSGLEGFVGNVEPRDLFRGRADVVVCDGFVGNLVLKTAEAAGAHLRLIVREGAARSLLVRLGALLVRGFLREIARRTDHQEIGGSLLLGLNGIAVVAHGASNARTLENAARLAARCERSGLVPALLGGFSDAQAHAGPGEAPQDTASA